ncbi:unnamed protein product [Linum tenue]|uniref:Uncharacterized protein n=1 Tax=Linum tenue TaxID=586396 RepID=A0AAV0HD28_9ROSI|nr:unnamed protein product [Linum tenue]
MTTAIGNGSEGSVEGKERKRAMTAPAKGRTAIDADDGGNRGVKGFWGFSIMMRRRGSENDRKNRDVVDSSELRRQR